MSENQSPKDFLIVDDHTLYLEALHLMIKQAHPKAVVMQASNVKQAMAALHAHTFKMALVDIELEERSGLDLLAECKTLAHPPKVLIISGHTQPDFVARVLRQGASGYLSKFSSRAELSDAITTVMSDRLFLSKDIARNVAESSIKQKGQALHICLSNREMEVFLLLARGFQLKDIASQLSLSVRTVAVHKFKVMRKTGLRTIVDVIRYCQSHRLVQYSHDEHLHQATCQASDVTTFEIGVGGSLWRHAHV